nr:MAG TPA: hypothetical protein [Caudoviricetes sp.]DAM72531.1 MAG TPA: hypothetical protein [Caudoviricetes sp.]DAV03573.1 MAG TPA: hypothetical protein [Caudoviricetes sp.]
MFEFLCLTNLNFKGRVRRRTKSGWEIARQADRLAQQRYGSNFDNPNNLVNRIAGRYLGNFNRNGTSWNTQVSKRTYMGLNDG